MKKQILTLTMCLALTSTAALAAGTNTVVQKVSAPAKVAAPAPAKPAVANTTGCTMGCPTEPPKAITREEAKKRFEERQAKEREHMYADLGLSDEQKVKAEALDVKTKAEAKPLLLKVKTEYKKLNDLKNQKASSLKIWRQEGVVKAERKALEKYFHSSRAAFEAILTPEQKTKFEARKKEMDKFRKCHKHCGGKGPHGHNHMGPNGPHGHDHMGPPPEGMGPNGPDGPRGPEPMGPPPEKK